MTEKKELKQEELKEVNGGLDFRIPHADESTKLVKPSKENGNPTPNRIPS